MGAAVCLKSSEQLGFAFVSGSDILRVQLFLFAGDGERATLVVKIRSCGILACAAFLRGTEPLPLDSTQASEHCLLVCQYVILSSK